MSWRSRIRFRWALAFGRLMRRRPSVRWIAAAAAAAGLSVIIVSFLIPVMTTFTVVAETEYVTGVSAPAATLTWQVQQAVVCAGPRPPLRPGRPPAEPCGGAVFGMERFSGYLDIESSVTFEIERLAEGPLRVGLRPVTTDSPGSVDANRSPFRVRLRSTSPTERPRRLPDPVFVRVPDPKRLSAAGTPVAFTVLATALSFGREAALRGVASQPVLRSGVVEVAGTTLIGRRPYTARELTLKYGDSVSTNPAREDALFSCLVRADDRPALQAIFRVESERLQIRGFYSEPQIESLTFFDRVTHDALFAVLWSVLGIALTVAAGFAGVRRQGGPE